MKRSPQEQTDEVRRLRWIRELEEQHDAARGDSVRRQLASLIRSARRNGSDVVPAYRPWRAGDGEACFPITASAVEATLEDLGRDARGEVEPDCDPRDGLAYDGRP